MRHEISEDARAPHTIHTQCNVHATWPTQRRGGGGLSTTEIKQHMRTDWSDEGGGGGTQHAPNKSYQKLRTRPGKRNKKEYTLEEATAAPVEYSLLDATQPHTLLAQKVQAAVVQTGKNKDT